MGGGKAPKKYLEQVKKEEIEDGTQKTLFGKDMQERCGNCGERRSEHIDYFDTGKKNICPHRKSMEFVSQERGKGNE
ncbi:hypothetical protein LCGC14_3045710 [marine sediment metagenome]|uniref:Uncharacterized protein n=1 Tax=marine sediment metagenome TaxID=412755 RepID=A0A0F8ZE53_9ZZZZ